jgi:N-methylhydantoinase A
VATNALLERKGARTALVTTQGFEDVIEIGRQARPQIYNLRVTRPAPLVARDLRFSVVERMGPDGSVVTELAQSDVTRAAENIAASGAESVAVCLLFSFANPAHEQQVARGLERLGLPVTLSHEILPEYREYERTSTTVINAYLVPLMSRYLRALRSGLDDLVGLNSASRQSPPELRRARGGSRRSRQLLRVMQSNGGSVSDETAAGEPVRAILSGPAGGVVGAIRVCKLAGIPDIIAFDMGGTSTDVSLCRGEARTTNEATIAGLPVAVPVIDIHTVGAGGGSIARVDQAGALRVGPESAGADPGPACYGRGDHVTVTDANLVLGRFGGTALLGGEMQLNLDRAKKFMTALARELSLFGPARVTPERAALGVVAVANANMERALRVVSIERGYDPRTFALVSFGGAGGLHAAELAMALRIPRVIIPRSPGTLSALGVLLGDVVKDYSRTLMVATAKLDRRAIERVFKNLERIAARDLATEGFTGKGLTISRSVAVRYTGQSFEIDVPWAGAFERDFHNSHQVRYGYADRARPTEIVSVRVRATGITHKPSLRRFRPPKTALAPRASHHYAAILPAASRPAATNRRAQQAPITLSPAYTPVYDRERLRPETRVHGPAIITEYSSTTLVPGRWTAAVDPWLNIVLESS